ncbi:hypothetical protein E4K10_22230 [Streptomyces sp. T1317-0309]|nr:hypothetical protein E4K10_22230 [Streptomyces sp. T1317-0309]
MAVLAAAALLNLLLGVVYGSEYTALSTAALLILAGAALRGAVVWSKVLPSALGFPGVRLAFVAVEGVCQLGMLAGLIRFCAGTSDRTLAWGWGYVGLVSLSTVGWFIVLRRLTRSMPDPSGQAPPGKVGHGAFVQGPTRTAEVVPDALGIRRMTWRLAAASA